MCGLSLDIARMDLRRLIFTIWWPGLRNDKNVPGETHFEHFYGLAPDIVKMGLTAFK